MVAEPMQNFQPGLDGWHKMLAESYTHPHRLLADLEIPVDMPGLRPVVSRQFPMKVPAAFVQRMAAGNPDDPLLRQVLPVADELILTKGFARDPLAEMGCAGKGVIHKYANRVLLPLTGRCAVNCRYCFRRYFPHPKTGSDRLRWQSAIDYVAVRANVSEVILSGGDPLMVEDHQIKWLLDRLARIPTLKRIRIHTRLPVVVPERLTAELANILTRTRLQTILVLHINHGNEINDQLAQSLKPLVRSGVTLLNQGVLLKGVNDAVSILAALSEKLFDAGILPYYLHTLDRVQGAGHFLVPDERARTLMAGLLGQVAGYLVPRLTREISGRDSKIPLDLYLA